MVSKVEFSYANRMCYGAVPEATHSYRDNSFLKS
jgi:hypothetical protein